MGVAMHDSTLIDTKAAELKEELERWVRKNRVLGPGECLVFTLRVDKRPLVEQDGVEENYWLMSPRKFFSKARLIAVGAPKGIATRAHNAACNVSADSEHTGPVIYGTMHEFVSQNSTVRDFAKLKNAGKVCAPYMLEALKSAGLISN
jgi:hypothetical protein